MTHIPFNLGLFASFGPPAWQAPDDRLNGGDWWTGEFLVDVARRAEAAKFDFIFFEDTSTVTTVLGGSMDADLKNNIYAPKQDPLQLLPLLAGATEHLGLIATASTTFYPPWILARLFSTLDSISSGRSGWNIVTSADSEAALNFGMDDLPDHATRYAMADDFLDVTKKLWGAWEPGAVVRDLASNTYIDPSKVRHVDHEGPFFKVRGPLNTVPSPQGHPLLVQAGSSPRGRDFSAKHSELIFAPTEGGVAGMKAFRDDIRERAAKFDRNPDDIKIIFASFPLFLPEGVTLADLPEPTDDELIYSMAFLSATLDTDLSQFDLNEPLPADLTPRGHTGLFVEMQEAGKRGQSLRDSIKAFREGNGLSLVGTPEEVAEQMAAAIDEVGGDGFMIITSNMLTAEYLDNITNRLVPALQKLGVTRTEYVEGATLREQLGQIR
ncbi:NtaA/DmoA family FMN-dependent monooxygenase [Microbacterium sp. NPDC077663]|uniref:NtaA/DmoA family FMN-dependent monooxygenase n=1 Tax=Microbacterium sp. NPDC077663 TaxID=3364189 RepID=UPI0037C6DD5A